MSRGTLRIRLDVPSIYLQGSLPVEVRDARLSVVARTAGGTALVLPEGLYRVSAMLDDGRMHERFARVVGGGSTEVVVRRGTDDEEASETLEAATAGPPSTPRSASREPGFRDVPPGRSPPDEESATAEAAGDRFEFVDVEGARLYAHDEDTWWFTRGNDFSRVPCARFAGHGRVVEVSLPINSLGPEESSGCVVRAQPKTVTVEFSPKRLVASTVLGLIRSKEVLRGMEILQATTTLLRDKYSDPVGAALGGLLLQRIGHLEERASWVDNLARDFPWLPDGRILKAALDRDSERPSDVEAALEIALAAVDARPLFTDAYSLLLQLLRRWPSDHRQEERRRAVERLAPRTAEVDWQQVVFTRTRTTRTGDP